MEKLLVTGGNTLKGKISVSGAKNVVLKAMVAACLTDEEVAIHNVPLISDVMVMADIIRQLGGEVTITDHSLTIQVKKFTHTRITLDQASHIRTSSMFISPLLIREKEATIPNPGGCRLGARPIDRTVEGLMHMGAEINYLSDDGFFHATTQGLKGTEYHFAKNTHTGTETMIIAAVMAKGKTILTNAAAEPEVDELITLLNNMGSKIKRVSERVIEIEGVEKLHGGEYTIKPDRNEIVTLAIAAHVTKGDIFINDAKEEGLTAFLEKLDEAGGGYEIEPDGIRFFYKGPMRSVDVTTEAYPGFMTDWQAPWAILMTQAEGVGVIHETIFSNRFAYVSELKKMGAKLRLFNPPVENYEHFYNFNREDDQVNYFHAVKITGPVKLHSAIVTISDLRAGASLVLSALAAKGETVIHGIHLIDRGYEQFEERLQKLGAQIKRVED